MLLENLEKARNSETQPGIPHLMHTDIYFPEAATLYPPKHASGTHLRHQWFQNSMHAGMRGRATEDFLLPIRQKS